MIFPKTEISNFTQ